LQDLECAEWACQTVKLSKRQRQGTALLVNSDKAMFELIRVCGYDDSPSNSQIPVLCSRLMVLVDDEHIQMGDSSAAPIKPSVPETAAIYLHANLKVPSSLFGGHWLNLAGRQNKKILCIGYGDNQEPTLRLGLSVWAAVILIPLPGSCSRSGKQQE